MDNHKPIPRRHGSRFTAGGFTLVVILAVMMVVLLLAGMILAGRSAVMSKVDRSRVQADLQRIKGWADEERLRTGSCPSANNSTNTVDPWGTTYGYLYNMSNGLLSVWSYGPDRINNTADDISF